MKYRSVPWLGTAVLAVGLAAGVASARAPVAPLVTVAWLKGHLHQPGTVILDVYLRDRQRSAYEKGHIPGAVFTGFFSDGWRAPVKGVPGQLPAQAKIDTIIGGFGIGPNTRVILVSGGSGLSHPNTFNAATWIYWALNAEGNHDVSILNGGDDAWRSDASAPMTTGAVAPHPVTFPGHLQVGYQVNTSEVNAARKDGSATLIDARPPTQFEGKTKSPQVLKAGTIPGAVNLPIQSLLTSDGQGLLPQAQIEQKTDAAGLKTGVHVIAFCNTSYWASGDWFVLRAVENDPNVVLYTGSMAAWTRHADLPVVAGKIGR